ncbi:MAG: UPF0280 family protein [Deltaproteobacteria bacterium]|nr:UPF0280 family protein [Deltaproteobacteria bacterium]
MERIYRKKVGTRGLHSFQVAVKETDLWICADRPLVKETRDLVLKNRNHLEHYISLHPDFLSTLQPFRKDPLAPPIVKAMIEATHDIGVGPMAAVAGAMAQFVAEGLREFTRQVIVENGGDVYLNMKKPMTVSVFAGKSALSERLGLKIPVEQMPMGVCSSSATIGHSLSLGAADLVCVLSKSAARADGAATALCNRIKNRKDLENVGRWAAQMGGIIGGLAVMGDALAPWGERPLKNAPFCPIFRLRYGYGVTSPPDNGGQAASDSNRGPARWVGSRRFARTNFNPRNTSMYGASPLPLGILKRDG